MEKGLATVLLIFGILLVMGVSGCPYMSQPLKAQTGAGSQHEISITPAANVRIMNLTFSPQEVRIKAGARVVWKNEDPYQHIVYAPDLLKSPALNKGDEFSFTFTQPGEYDYICAIYGFKGKVIVE